MIKENLDCVKSLQETLRGHIVGGTDEISSTHITRIFFENWQGLGGIRVSLDKGKINALRLMIGRLDDLYNAENKFSSHHTPLKSI